MVTVSPPVSPRVVAAILMIQKPRMTSGTLLRDSCSILPFIASVPLPLAASAAEAARKENAYNGFWRRPRGKVSQIQARSTVRRAAGFGDRKIAKIIG